MQLRRSVLFALMIILFIYFQIHSCSGDNALTPTPPDEIPSVLCNASDIFFVDMEHGWVTGQYGTMIRTSDGGKEWEPVQLDQVDISSISFLDTDKGWLVGKGGKIFRSEDGGITWERRLFPGTPGDDDLFQIVFSTDNIGFIQGYHGVFVTDTGGDDWENNWLPIVEAKGAWSMSMIDEKTGFLLGSKWNDSDPELLYRTDTGGKVWSPVEGSRTSVLRSILTIEFIDEETGWAGGGIIMNTMDGGDSWVLQLEEATVREFCFLDNQYGYAVGGLTILKTTDGGDTWMDITPDDNRFVDLRGICFIDCQTGWVVGRGREETVGDRTYKYSIVMKTGDGGDTWVLREFAYEITGILLTDQ